MYTKNRNSLLKKCYLWFSINGFTWVCKEGEEEPCLIKNTEVSLFSWYSKSVLNLNAFYKKNYLKANVKVKLKLQFLLYFLLYTNTGVSKGYIKKLTSYFLSLVIWYCNNIDPIICKFKSIKNLNNLMSIS